MERRSTQRWVGRGLSGHTFARIAATLAFGAGLLAGVSLPAQAAGAQYVYDAAGRLIQVISPNGSSAQYRYDPAGNLSAITPLTPTTAAVTGFANAAGAVGSTTTIYGSGFSTTPGANQVFFNGVAATVVSATANALVVVIPSGATSGPVKVTDSNGTVTSNGSFVVNSGNPAPSIASISPQVGLPGTAVTINGSQFQTVIANDDVSFAGFPATVSTAASGVLTTAVPAGASSGRISVSTPFGSATGSDFFVPPGGNTATVIGSTGRLVIDGAPLTASIATAGKLAMIVFDGQINQRIALEVSAETFPSDCGTGAIFLYAPGANTVEMGTAEFCAAASAFTLPATGTYTLLLVPSGSDTGSITLQLQNVPTISKPITIDGAAVTVTTTLPTQQAQLTFTSTSANQIISVQTSANTYPVCEPLSLSGPAPLTANINSTDVCTSAAAFTLPTAGTYTLTVVPSGSDTGTVTVRVQSAPTLSSSITIDGAPVTMTTPVPAQQAQLTFTSSSANQIISVQTSASTYPNCESLNLTGPAPATTSINSTDLCPGATAFTLPTVGTYTLTLTSPEGDTGSVTVRIQNAPTVSKSLTIGGPAVTVTTTVPAQQAQWTFTSSRANQTINVQTSGSTYPNCESLNLTGPAPQNPSVGATDLCAGATSFTLTSVGTYTLTLVPFEGDTGSVAIQIH
jgi:large repetitive protein